MTLRALARALAAALVAFFIVAAAAALGFAYLLIHVSLARRHRPGRAVSVATD